jgi:hypothetical protein
LILDYVERTVVIANVQHPILSTDFLRHFSRLVDMRNHKLSYGLTALRIQGISCNAKSPSPAILPRKPLRYPPGRISFDHTTVHI